MAGVAR